MKIAVVIPARYGSTRFPGKPLALICGRPMIQWTIEGARKSRLANEILVATDHLEIKKAAEAAGAEAVMTASDLPSGSDRINAAIQNRECDIVVNVQGDEPLVAGELIDLLAQALVDSPEVAMATLAYPISAEEMQTPNAVKVILNERQEAIYFSRFPIPYTRQEVPAQGPYIPMKHIGMYAYRKNFLADFCARPPGALEQGESLEQLRALEMGEKIKVIKVNEPLLGVDVPEDVFKIEQQIKNQRK